MKNCILILLLSFLFFSCPSPNSPDGKITIYHVIGDTSSVYNTTQNSLNISFSIIQELHEKSYADSTFIIIISGTVVEDDITFNNGGNNNLTIILQGSSSLRGIINAQKKSSVLTLQGKNLHVTLGDNLTLTNGLAGEGGGVHVLDSTLTIDGATITNNTAYFAGGGVYIKNGTFNMHSGSILYNIASGREKSSESSSDDSFVGHGGGVYLTGSKTSTNINGLFEIIDTEAFCIMTGGTITDNTATGPYGGGSGGGVYLHHNVDAKKTDSIIIQNNNADYEEDICEFYSSFLPYESQ